MLRLFRAPLCAVLILASSTVLAEAPASTHKQARSVAPVFEGHKLQLNTFCMGPDENLWLCCGGLPTATEASKGSILIYQPSGEFVRRIELSFVPQAINFTADGSTAFIAGSGMIAKLSAAGEVLSSVKAPNLLDEEEMKKKLQAAQEKQIKEMMQSFDEQVERLTKQVEKLNEQIAAAKEKDDQRALKRAESRLKVAEQTKQSMEENAKQMKESFGQAFSGENVMDRVKRATGLAITKDDVFVTLPSLEGYGYALWRMNYDLQEPCCIKENISGCCGQLDIQTDGADVLVAENTSFRVVRIDRDGKELGHFGQRGNGDSGSGWGSCCNPMNIRPVGDELLVGESSVGHLKRYTKDGEYLGLIGTARIGGGCKHVALAVDAKRNWYFMMNQNGNSIAVLIPKDDVQGETEEERLSREARDGLGKKLTGAWEYAGADSKPAGADDQASLDAYILQQYKYLHFHTNGQLHTTKAPATRARAKKAPDETQAAQAGETKESSGGSNALGGLLESVVQAVTSPAAVVTGGEAYSAWEAVRQDKDSLQFVILSSGVRGFGGTVNFVDADTATIQWFYDSPESPYGQPLTYKRVPGQCCENGSDCERCKK